MLAVAQRDFNKGGYLSVAMIAHSAKDVAVRFGVEFEEYDTDGLGMALGQHFRAANGAEFHLEQWLGAGKPHLHISCRHADSTEKKEATLLTALETLAVRPEHVAWVSKELEAGVKAKHALRP